MAFYTFTQNNSGGFWLGPRYVIVEAPNADAANAIAVDSCRVYFNGVDDDRGCECCGNRWYPTYDSAGTDEPEIYGDTDLGPRVENDNFSTTVRYRSGSVYKYNYE